MSGLPVSDEKHVYDNILGAIGQTPLVRLGRVAASVQVPIYAKLENLNPGGSIKDRVGLNIIEGAEQRGELKPGGRWWKPRPAIPAWGWPLHPRSKVIKRFL